MRLKLVINQIVFCLALFPARQARPPVLFGRLHVHVYNVLAQIARGGVQSAAIATLGPLVRARPWSRPCNTEAALEPSTRERTNGLKLSVSVKKALHFCMKHRERWLFIAQTC